MMMYMPSHFPYTGKWQGWQSEKGPFLCALLALPPSFRISYWTSILLPLGVQWEAVMVMDWGTSLLPIKDVEQVHCLLEKWQRAPFRSVLKRQECWYLTCLRKASFSKDRQLHQSPLLSHSQGMLSERHRATSSLRQTGKHAWGGWGAPSLPRALFFSCSNQHSYP